MVVLRKDFIKFPTKKDTDKWSLIYELLSWPEHKDVEIMHNDVI